MRLKQNLNNLRKKSISLHHSPPISTKYGKIHTSMPPGFQVSFKPASEIYKPHFNIGDKIQHTDYFALMKPNLQRHRIDRQTKPNMTINSPQSSGVPPLNPKPNTLITTRNDQNEAFDFNTYSNYTKMLYIVGGVAVLFIILKSR